ncbi:hypothetical protein [Aquimarina sp. 2201CG14-23]|uniref:hypothetical protein n=1 Tax=Aquimarina mycalae TaxID=3040073 RepID=UPI0024780096|nr:hypothetical protein [Aquimarina sp. 2201CG14-23]MDH7446931.1 hypothetical protein [Aquimarina sp. 2201CG14-23]
MKKITLLVVAAIFVIGTQSCTTDENVFEEETFINNETNAKNLIYPGSTNLNKECKSCVTAFYPESMPESTREAFRSLMRGQVFSTLLKDIENSCGTKEAWVIDQYDPILFNRSGVDMGGDPKIIVTEGTIAVAVETSDIEETHRLGKKISTGAIGDFTYEIYRMYERPLSCGGGF